MKEPDSISNYVAFYLEKLKSGDFEVAFHALNDAGHSVIPMLIEAFRHESSSAIRAELVEIIWNHRQPETVVFLGEALNDSDAKVWKSALDGLVTFASPAALQILQAASNRELPNKNQQDEFRRWVNEAIAQI